MHEMSIAQHIIQIADEQLGKLDGPGELTRVNLKVGRLRGIIPESLEFCFSVLAKGTRLESAELHIEQVPVRIVCRCCGAALDLEAPLFACGACGAVDVQVVSGEELEIESIEVEVPEERNAGC